MKNKLILMSLMLSLYSFNCQAITNSEEYNNCIKNSSSDEAMTKCMQNEIKYFEKMIKDDVTEMKKIEFFQPLMTQKEYNIDMQKKFLDDFLNSYCRYYTTALAQSGYSKDYLDAECRLGFMQMHAGYQSGNMIVGLSGCIQDEITEDDM